MNNEPEFITPAQLAEKLNISKTTVLTKIRNNEWECTRFGERIYRFSQEQVEVIKGGDNHRQLKTNKSRLRAALKAIS